MHQSVHLSDCSCQNKLAAEEPVFPTASGCHTWSAWVCWCFFSIPAGLRVALVADRNKLERDHFHQRVAPAEGADPNDRKQLMERYWGLHRVTAEGKNVDSYSFSLPDEIA
jgi:hypothetical protein